MTQVLNNENVLSIIFESTHMMVAYLDTDLRFVRVNTAYAAADDKDPDFFVGKKHFDLFPNKENQEIFRRVIATGEPHYSYAKPFEYEYSPERGTSHWDWSLYPSKDEGGRVTGAVLQLVNVTDRILAEEKLRIEQDFGNAVLASANALVVVLDSSGRIRRFNKACEKLTGYKFEEVEDRYLWDKLLRDEDVGAAKKIFSDLATSGLPDQLTSCWLAKDKTPFLIDWNNSVMTSEDGAIRYVIAIGVDVTEKQHALEDLELSEDILKSAQSISHIGTWNWDLQSNHLDWSDEIYNIFGLTDRDFGSTYEHFLDFVHPEDRPNVEGAVSRSLADPDVPYEVDHRIIRSNGETRFVKETGKVYSSEDGRPIRMIGIVQDVTQILDAENALFESYTINEEILANAPAGISLYRETGECIAANNTVAEIIGATREQVLSQNFHEIESWKKFGLYDIACQVMKNGKKLSSEVQIETTFGKKVYLHFHFTRIEISNSNYLLLMLEDIAERKKSEQEILRQEAQLNSFFSQSLNGFFFMMMDRPIEWNEHTDKEKVLDYVFEHQRITKANDAFAKHYGGELDSFIGLTPKDFFVHDVEYGRRLWRSLFDLGRLNIQTEEKKIDGASMWIEGEYVCMYDDDGRITGHFGVQREITEQKQMEDDMRVNQTRLNEAQRIAKVGSWELELHSNKLFWTDEIYSLFELDKDRFDASYEAFLEAIHPEDREAVNVAYTQSLENQKPYAITHRLLLADGRVKWVEERCSTVFAEDGTPLISKGTVQDVTLQRQVVSALEENEQLLSKAEEIAHVGCWNWNIVTNDLAWTDEIYRMLGYQPQEFAADFQKFVELIHPDDREAALAAVMASVEDPKVPYDIVHRIVREDGTGIVVREKGEVYRDSTGAPQYMIGIAQDITEQQRAQSEMQYSQARFGAMFDSISDAVIVADTSRRITLVNKATLAQFGFREDELIGKATEILYADPEDYRQTGKDRYNEKTTPSLKAYEIRYRRKNGSVFWGETLGTRIESEGVGMFGFVGVIRDITERKHSQQELMDYRERLEELVVERTRELENTQKELVRKERLATLGQLTATVSHELRNPLGAMRPSLYIVQRSSDTRNEKVQRALARLDRNINRCDHIIDELLDFTRITVLEQNEVVLDNWIQQLLEEQTIPEGVRLVRDLTLEGMQTSIDTHRLRRALINVIENGLHAMQEEGSPPKRRGAQLTVFTRELEDGIEIGVRDTGIGISDEVLPHIFEPLYSTKGFGVGLGMPTVKQIVEQHGGDIAIETTVGVGTTVRLLLPRRLEAGCKEGEL